MTDSRHFRVSFLTKEARFEVPYSQAKLCGAVRVFVEADELEEDTEEDSEEDTEDAKSRAIEYAVPGIDDDTMCRVIKYLEYHEHVPETVDIQLPIVSNDFGALVSEAFYQVTSCCFLVGLMLVCFRCLAAVLLLSCCCLAAFLLLAFICLFDGLG